MQKTFADLRNRIARTKGLDILSLNINFARPSPAIGWENGENLSFIESAEGAFDGVSMLAVLHHLLINERTFRCDSYVGRMNYKEFLDY